MSSEENKAVVMKADEEPCDERWKKFLRRHWEMSLLMIGGIAGAAIVAILVFLWVVAVKKP